MLYELCKLMQSTVANLQLLFYYYYFYLFIFLILVTLHMQVIRAVFVPAEGRAREQALFLRIHGYLLSVNNKASKYQFFISEGKTKNKAQWET